MLQRSLHTTRRLVFVRKHNVFIGTGHIEHTREPKTTHAYTFCGPSPVFSMRSSVASGLCASAARLCSTRSARDEKPGGAQEPEVHGLQYGSEYIYESRR